MHNESSNAGAKSRHRALSLVSLFGGSKREQKLLYQSETALKDQLSLRELDAGRTLDCVEDFGCALGAEEKSSKTKNPANSKEHAGYRIQRKGFVALTDRETHVI